MIIAHIIVNLHIFIQDGGINMDISKFSSRERDTNCARFKTVVPIPHVPTDIVIG